jgi:hypothetical protein
MRRQSGGALRGSWTGQGTDSGRRTIRAGGAYSEPVAVYDIRGEGGKLVARKRHPFLNFCLIAFAVLLVVGSVMRNPWLIIPTVMIVALAVMALRAKARRSS